MNFIGHKHYNKKLVSKPLKPLKSKKKKKKKIKADKTDKKKLKPSFPQTKSRALHPINPQAMTINIFNVPSDMNEAVGKIRLPNRLGINEIPLKEEDRDYGFEKFEPKKKVKKFKGDKIKLDGDGREAIEKRLKDISVHDSIYGSDKDSEYRRYDYTGRIDRIENPNDWDGSDGSDKDYVKDLGVPYPKPYFKNQEEKEEYIGEELDNELYKRRMKRFDSNKEPTILETLMRKTRDYDETNIGKQTIIPKDTREEMRINRIARFEPPVGNTGISDGDIDDYESE
jgi:hypothetical protein